MAQPQANQGTEQRLLESALKLFSERGYDGTSVREIIESAGVTRPVLYYYFENKEDLFRKLVEMCLQHMVERTNTVIEKFSSCGERLNALIFRVFEDTEESPESARLMLQVFFSVSQCFPEIDRDDMGRQRVEPFVKIMLDGIENGELRDADPLTLALAFAGLMNMHIMAKLYQPDARLSGELGEELVNLFMEGASSKGDYDGKLNSPFKI